MKQIRILFALLLIKNIYPFKVKIPEGEYIESASILLGDRNQQEGLNMLMLGTKEHPSSCEIPGAIREIFEYYEKTENMLLNIIREH